MLDRRWFGLFFGGFLCLLLVLPARGGIIGPFDTARVLEYNQVGGSDPRSADSDIHTYDSTVDHPAGFVAGDGAVDLLDFTLPKFDIQAVATRLGVNVAQIRLEQIVINMGAKTIGGYNVIDNESPLAGTVTNLTIGAEVTVRSTSVPQQVTLSALPKKNLAANGPLTIGADELPEIGGAPVPLFGGKTLNANFIGPDSLQVDITDMIRVASEVVLRADATSLAGFIGDGTINWKASGQKIASDQSNITRQTRNVSPTFDLETQVVYIYSVGTPVPEPASLAALGLGFLPLLARWRKRRQGRS